MIAVQRDELCDRLKQLRLKAGFTQERLGEILMISQYTVSRIENGRIPDAEVFIDWIAVCTNEPIRFTVKGW